MTEDQLTIITTCIGYGDFLIESAKYNRLHATNYIVVTTDTDNETREVCRRYKISTLLTDDHKRDGDFSKGRIIDRALMLCPRDSWVLHLDADVVLPATFCHDLNLSNLDQRKIYGFDRFLVKSYEQWQKLVATGWPLGTKFYNHPHVVKVPDGYSLGARWVGTDGWVPIGFAQLFHTSDTEWSGARVKTYPKNHGAACRTDTQFAMNWDRRERELLGEVFVAHLESEEAPVGTNWKGRRTKRFGPPLTPSNNSSGIS